MEGHTVFTVIQPRVTLNATREAAAVAVFIREYVFTSSRFNGTLWFNDQFLVPPAQKETAKDMGACGGAVLAVNRGDPSPLAAFASPSGIANAAGSAAGTSIVASDAPPVPGSLSWLDVPVAAASASANASTTATFTYIESYSIDDPNDHSWIVDKYVENLTTTVTFAGGPNSTSTTTFPVWAVDVLSKAAFAPDSGSGCTPDTDDPQSQSQRESFTPNVGNALSQDGVDAKSPSLGYYEATDNASNGGPPGSVSYCYEGNPNTEGTAPGTGCSHGGARGGRTPHPLRLYNAVLFFFLGPEDVLVTSRSPHGVADTNGCQVGTEWVCPGGNDDAEGNSHPFNPPGVFVPGVRDPLNHSTTLAGGVWVDTQDLNPGRTCDGPVNRTTQRCAPEEHAAHDRGLIDIYFSPDARPAEPPVRKYAVTDANGSSDPFYEDDGNGAANVPAKDYPPTLFT